MTIQKRDWRVKSPVKIKKKFDMLDATNDEGKKQKRLPKKIKPHLLPSQVLKE